MFFFFDFFFDFRISPQKKQKNQQKSTAPSFGIHHGSQLASFLETKKRHASGNKFVDIGLVAMILVPVPLITFVGLALVGLRSMIFPLRPGEFVTARYGWPVDGSNAVMKNVHDRDNELPPRGSRGPQLGFERFYF